MNEWPAEPECTCPFVNVGTYTTDSRNWNEECRKHGLGTEWYKQQAKERRNRTLALHEEKERRESGEGR